MLTLKCQVQIHKCLLTTALVDFAIKWSPSLFDSKLFVLRWMKCKPLFWEVFHSFKHGTVSWWKGPEFKFMLPETNNNNWENEFEFLYWWWYMVMNYNH